MLHDNKPNKKGHFYRESPTYNNYVEGGQGVNKYNGLMKEQSDIDIQNEYLRLLIISNNWLPVKHGWLGGKY